MFHKLLTLEDLTMFSHEVSFELKVRNLKTYDKEVSFSMSEQSPKNADAWEYLKTRLINEIERIDAERAKQCDQ
jgi:hypothetical protein